MQAFNPLLTRCDSQCMCRRVIDMCMLCGSGTRIDIDKTLRYVCEVLLQAAGVATPYGRRHFLQRYFICDKHWKRDENSPIFFYAGNEADVTLYAPKFVCTATPYHPLHLQPEPKRVASYF